MSTCLRTGRSCDQRALRGFSGQHPYEPTSASPFVFTVEARDKLQILVAILSALAYTSDSASSLLLSAFE